MSLFAELKRRNVFRVGIAYVLMGWVLLQGADFVFDLIGAPEWVIRALAVVVVVGLPIALFFAWAFELTPEGIKREAEVDRSQSITSNTGRRLDRIIIAFLAVVIVVMGLERFYNRPATGESAPVDAATSSEEPVATDVTTTTAGPAKSIAVLPFADLSQAGDQEWFADGLAEEILNALTRIPDLQVSSRTSAFRYKGSDLGIPEIAAELGVAHVLEGSVRSAGQRIRVTAQLIRADDGFHVWSENYDREEADMIGIQEDLARSIATALETTLDPAALAAMSQAGTRSVAAYRAYLEGLASLREANTRADANTFLSSLQQFELASSLDPRFSAAYLRVADAWKIQLDPTNFFYRASGLDSAEKLRRFSAAIELAIQNAPTATDRQGYEAQRAEVELRLRDAMRLYQAYLEQRPYDDAARTGLINVTQMAYDLPRVNQILEYYRDRGRQEVDMASAYLGSAYQYRPAKELAEFALAAAQRWPDYSNIIYQAHRTMMWIGRIQDGATLAQHYARFAEGDDMVGARQACIEGRPEVAERLLDTLERAGDESTISRRWLVLRMLGRDEQAEQLLQHFAGQYSTYEMAYFTGYRIFDARSFPALMAALTREGVEVPPPLELPYRCPAPGAAP